MGGEKKKKEVKKEVIKNQKGFQMVVVARCRASGVCISSDTKVVYVRMTCLISTRIVIPGRRWGVDPFRQRVGAEFLLEVCAVSSGSQKRLYGIVSAV